MAKKRPSIVKQVTDRLNKMVSYGESRHQAKKEYKQYCQDNNLPVNNVKTAGIHDRDTFQNIQTATMQFTKWARENFRSEVKNIEDLEPKHAKAYLDFRKENGKAPTTLRNDMTCINKVFDLNLTKENCNLPSKSYKNVTNNVTDRKRWQFNEENFKDQIDLIKATGMRRSSVFGGEFQVKQGNFWREPSSGRMMVTVVEKGGRLAHHHVLKDMEDRVIQIAGVDPSVNHEIGNLRAQDKQLFKENFYDKDTSSPVISSFSHHCPSHRFKAEYAFARYDEILQDLGRDPANDYRGYDKEALLILSQDLGHNRAAVSVYSYLKKNEIIQDIE